MYDVADEQHQDQHHQDCDHSDHNSEILQSFTFPPVLLRVRCHRPATSDPAPSVRLTASDSGAAANPAARRRCAWRSMSRPAETVSGPARTAPRQAPVEFAAANGLRHLGDLLHHQHPLSGVGGHRRRPACWDLLHSIGGRASAVPAARRRHRQEQPDLLDQQTRPPPGRRHNDRHRRTRPRTRWTPAYRCRLGDSEQISATSHISVIDEIALTMFRPSSHFQAVQPAVTCIVTHRAIFVKRIL